MFYARLRMVYQDPRIDAAQAALAFQKEGQALSVRIRVDLKEPGQTLLSEQIRREGVGRTEAADRVPGPLRWPPQVKHRAGL